MVVPFYGCLRRRKITRISFQPLGGGADALCISAEVAAPDARLGTNINAAAALRCRRDAYRDVVLEAEPLGGVDRLDGACGGIPPGDLPAHRLGGGDRPGEGFPRRDRGQHPPDGRVRGALPAPELAARVSARVGAL